MNSDNKVSDQSGARPGPVVYWLGVTLVIVGLINVTPAIPGWDGLWRSATGLDFFKIRRFPTEWLYPIVFVWMMIIVALSHSIWRAWREKSVLRRRFGLFLDVALVLAGLIISGTYLVELEAVCLLDVITGDRARLIAEALQSEVEYSELMGLPVPETADDPSCLNNTGGWLPLILFGSVLVFLGYNIKVWGLPLVLISIMIASYTFLTVMNWYVFGADGQNKYLVTILSSEEVRSLTSGREFVRDALVNNTAGLLGRFINILMLLVFPYIILGALFGRCAGGQALIKLAFSVTRNMRGGPAHAAVVSSAMFGTITGGPVVNVLSTGVLTIPMMLKRGFSKVFAGGVEAAASSGGSIMPPIMGVAAFIMASLTGVPYRQIIIAAAIPAAFYFFCLFLSVIFQARKQNIEAVGELTDDMRLTGQDRLQLMQIFGPVLLVLILLLTPKDAVGCSWISVFLGAVVERNGDACMIQSLPWIVELVQNGAGDASAAGWWAVMLLLGLMFLDKEFRARPRKILDALSTAGVLISTLYLMFLAVTVIDVSLNFTGLAKFVAIDVLAFLKSFDVSANSAGSQLLALGLTMLLAVLLGMGMPAVPAYINAALLMGPMLVGLGLATFTAHMFIFYFAVASAITPPVALAAFAAASITNADPMKTGFSAVKSGIVMFTIPFIFAIYPELLLIKHAVIDPATGLFLPGYDGRIDVGWLMFLIARLALALYLVSSAMAAFDYKALSPFQVGLRIILAILVVTRPVEIYGPAILAGIGVITMHVLGTRKGVAA
ncbi:MAG TPA: C4-dicarboxylate ABC transporter [Alphaproteobacteria bacterium]|jgi:TRAP transporter 4TM/12TM fusion protein|nr:C4-dicarboxylate ABC transporter [Rhodospirillaceae bacterium]PDH62058.1 MAG: C4-dicarboxylate ABC transporter [SAR116 cluster bacterium MED-G05]HCM09071.1 C4-dicarboxylate ABC transporter [Alphaproteobacteria bacterium]|tara:strand:- start:16277 stop:18613 length:2337 start_codon:yes stop_codon:yes gene_type:complete